MKLKYGIMALILLSMGFTQCGGSADGGTETGTTSPGEIDTTTVGDRIDATASAVLLSVNASAIDASVAAASTYLIDGTADEWSVYLNSDNSYVITDIFGAPDETPEVVTKIRVLLEHFSEKVTEVFVIDENIDCTGTTPLTDADMIEFSFYGELDNGSAGDRYYDCVSVNETDNVTFVYGIDSNNIIRLVEMKETVMANTEEIATRGTQVEHHSVVSAVYAEQSESDETVAYLDVQYTQGTFYSGVDESFDTSDDIIFRSRSRILGRAVLSESGDVSDGVGDFSVTKYDSALTPESVPYEVVTQVLGRGDFSDGSYSLFKIDSDVDALESLDGTFCIQSSDTALPAVTDTTNCTALETAFAWGEVTFPFDISPAISATFDDNDFFAGDDIDLITADGSNFTIPTY